MVDIVTLLLQHGAKPSTVNPMTGTEVLHSLIVYERGLGASDMGRLVRALVAAGADIERWHPRYGTPLKHAVARANLAAVRGTTPV